MTPPRIKVMVVDDSLIARRLITESLAAFPEIEVVGTAPDPYAARDRILELKPDVLTLDIEMPRMDGLTFLKAIMKHRPMPVIIISTLTTAGSEKAWEALQAGAVDVMEKMTAETPPHLRGLRLAEAVKAAAAAKVRPATFETARLSPPARGIFPARTYPERSVILLGASTGGTEALKKVLPALPPQLPGICVVQHIPPLFSKTFAQRLDGLCALEVREAKNHDVVKPGLVLIAPGDYHMLLRWQADHYEVELNQGPPIHHQRPSVDILFDSAARAGAGPHAVAALLTGMGADGADGLLRLRQEGAATIAQDEDSCVVFGMPREAIVRGAAQHITPLDEIGARLEQLAAAQTTPSRAATPAISLS